MKKIILLMICAFSLIANAQSTKSNKMFNLLAKFTVKPQSVPEFMEACVHSLKESRKEAGNIEMKLFADKKKSNVFYVYSRWDNAVAYEFHKTLPHSKNIANVAKATLVKVPEIMPLGATLPATVRGAKQVNSEDQVETLFFIFKIKEGYRDRIIKRFETHVEHSRTEEGNLLFEFYTIEGDENTFLVYEKWRNPDAVWKTHMNQPYSKLTGSLINEALVGEMEQYLNFVTELEPNSLKPLSKNWELEGFEMPESVVADPNSDWIYVSNIVNRTTPGYISRISKNGKLDNYKWLEGLNQPCGLEIFDNKLYVGDQDKVHIIDIEKAKIIKSLLIEGAMALNDVAISPSGEVFISDVLGSKIYTIENDQLVLWLENAPFKHPNGLYVDADELIVADLGAKLNPDASPQIPGSVYKVNIATKNIELMASGFQIGGLDGVTKVGENYIVTNNSGGELLVINNKERILLGTLPRGIADLDSEDQTIYVPNFGGTVTAFKLIK
nr:antibiotic biosynthesis monooxygenase [uncultured Marinifilum sp.]